MLKYFSSLTLKNDFQPCETEKLNQAKSLMFQQGRVEGRGHDRKRQAQTKPNIFRGTLTAAALGKHIYIHTYMYVRSISCAGHTNFGKPFGSWEELKENI